MPSSRDTEIFEQLRSIQEQLRSCATTSEIKNIEAQLRSMSASTNENNTYILTKLTEHTSWQSAHEKADIVREEQQKNEILRLDSFAKSLAADLGREVEAVSQKIDTETKKILTAVETNRTEAKTNHDTQEKKLVEFEGLRQRGQGMSLAFKWTISLLGAAATIVGLVDAYFHMKGSP